MPPMEEMLHLVNSFVQQKSSLERANFEWLWKTNSKLIARLISPNMPSNQSSPGSMHDELASRKLTGICHCFSSYFSNLKMCMHIHGLMSAEEGDIFLKPQTLELAESLVEANLRWMFFYKSLNKQQVQQNLHKAQSTHSQNTGRSAQSDPKTFANHSLFQGLGSLQGLIDRQPPNDDKDILILGSERRLPSVFVENKNSMLAEASTGNESHLSGSITKVFNYQPGRI